jgi:hypothetical protein
MEFGDVHARTTDDPRLPAERAIPACRPPARRAAAA